MDIETIISSFEQLQRDKIGLSPSGSGHLVKELTGKPINYLIGTDYRMKEIAALSGFGSQEHFIRSFREKYSKTPAEFRKASQGTF